MTFDAFSEVKISYAKALDEQIIEATVISIYSEFVRSKDSYLAPSRQPSCWRQRAELRGGRVVLHHAVAWAATDCERLRLDPAERGGCLNNVGLLHDDYNNSVPVFVSVRMTGEYVHAVFRQLRGAKKRARVSRFLLQL